MRQAKIAQLKNQLSRYLALVRQGETIRILDRDVPIAQIVPIRAAAGSGGIEIEALAEMERKGIIRRGSGKLDKEILSRDPPGKPSGVLEALLEERDTR
jgi:antitoxin (DNA-binding transcriptional repressor) of toxin-antitoxin stability system